MTIRQLLTLLTLQLCMVAHADSAPTSKDHLIPLNTLLQRIQDLTAAKIITPDLIVRLHNGTGAVTRDELNAAIDAACALLSGDFDARVISEEERWLLTHQLSFYKAALTYDILTTELTCALHSATRAVRPGQSTGAPFYPTSASGITLPTDLHVTNNLTVGNDLRVDGVLDLPANGTIQAPTVTVAATGALQQVGNTVTVKGTDSVDIDINKDSTRSAELRAPGDGAVTIGGTNALAVNTGNESCAVATTAATMAMSARRYLTIDAGVRRSNLPHRAPADNTVEIAPTVAQNLTMGNETCVVATTADTMAMSARRYLTLNAGIRRDGIPHRTPSDNTIEIGTESTTALLLGNSTTAASIGHTLELKTGSGQYAPSVPLPSAAIPLIQYAYIGEDGSIISSSTGMSCTHTPGTGQYDVTFGTAYTTAPIIMVTPENVEVPRAPLIGSHDLTATSIWMYDFDADFPVDTAFNLLIMGI